jgi:hypothetical protein
MERVKEKFNEDIINSVSDRNAQKSKIRREKKKKRNQLKKEFYDENYDNYESSPDESEC